jgi:hypothetical protein
MKRSVDERDGDVSGKLVIAMENLGLRGPTTSWILSINWT